METCTSCGAHETRRRWNKEHFVYAQCAGCGLTSLRPLPSQAEAAQVYSRDYFSGAHNAGYLDYAKDEPLHLQNAARRLQIIQQAGGAPPGSLIDVGCAHGFFAQAARRSGWMVAGVDVSAYAREQARARFGLPVYQRLEDVRAALGPSSDVVTFFQSLEHDVRPDLALAAARGCLRPGGLLVIETWDHGSFIARLLGSHWQQLSPPSVVHVFDRDSLRTLLTARGFGVRSIRSTQKTVSLGAIAGLLRSKYPRALRPLELVERTPALSSIGVLYSLGDLITVVATADL